MMDLGILVLMVCAPFALAWWMHGQVDKYATRHRADSLDGTARRQNREAYVARLMASMQLPDGYGIDDLYEMDDALDITHPFVGIDGMTIPWDLYWDAHFEKLRVVAVENDRQRQGRAEHGDDWPSVEAKVL